MIYYNLAILIFLFSLYDISVESKSNTSTVLLSKTGFFLFLAALIALGGLRWQTGTDWPAYYNYYTLNSTWKEYNNGLFEIAYAFLNFIVHFLFNSYTAFLLIFTSLVVLIKFSAIKRIALYPALTFYLYYCSNVGDVLAVRQYLAVSIMLISIYYIHCKDKARFFLLLVLATSIHNASILWIFAYYVYHKRFSWLLVVTAFIAALCIGLFGSGVFLSILNLMLMPFKSAGRAMAKIIYYLNDYGNPYFSMTKTIISIIKRIIFFPVFLFLRKRISEKNEYAYGLINLYFFGNIIYLLFTFSFTQFQRMTVPYVFTEIFIIPVILRTIKKQYTKYLFLMLILLYGIFKLYSAINPFKECLLPYYSIFNYENRF